MKGLVEASPQATPSSDLLSERIVGTLTGLRKGCP